MSSKSICFVVPDNSLAYQNYLKVFLRLNLRRGLQCLLKVVVQKEQV